MHGIDNVILMLFNADI